VTRAPAPRGAALALVASLALHGVALAAMSNVPAPAPTPKPERVELRVVSPPPPPEAHDHPPAVTKPRSPPSRAPTPAPRADAPAPRADTPTPPPVDAPPPVPAIAPSEAVAGAGGPSVAVSEGGSLNADPASGGVPGGRGATPGAVGSEPAPAAPRGPSRAASVSEMPDLRRFYPRDAALAGQTGKTIVEVQVAKDGCVLAMKILKSEPPGVFDEAARRVLEETRFTPALTEGEVVEATKRIVLKWEL
jgi:protein TonB